MKRLTNILILIAILSAARSFADDWPMFRGNPQNTGVAGSSLPDQPTLLWVYALPESGFESTPAIVGDTVYVTGLDGGLYALDITNGKPRWKYQADDEIKSSPTVNKNTVYFGDAKGTFHAVDAASGKKKWSFSAGSEIVSSAVVVGERILFGSYDNSIYCLDLNTGKQIWSLETASYVHATPAVDQGNVVIGGCDGKLRTISIEDGKEKAQLDLGAYVAATVAIRKDAYVGTFGNSVLSMDLSKNAIGWKYTPAKSFPFYSSAAVTDQALIIGGRDKALHAIDPKTGKSVWIFETQSKIDCSPVIAGSRVWFAETSGIIYGIDTATGKVAWKYPSGMQISGSPAVAQGKLVIASHDGSVFCFGEKK